MAQLVARVIWDHEAARSSRATPTADRALAPALAAPPLTGPYGVTIRAHQFALPHLGQRDIAVTLAGDIADSVQLAMSRQMVIGMIVHLFDTENKGVAAKSELGAGY